jgi:hypothetical protein
MELGWRRRDESREKSYAALEENTVGRVMRRIVKVQPHWTYHNNRTRSTFGVTVTFPDDVMMALVSPSDPADYVRYVCAHLAREVEQQLAAINFSRVHELKEQEYQCAVPWNATLER